MRLFFSDESAEAAYAASANVMIPLRESDALGSADRDELASQA